MFCLPLVAALALTADPTKPAGPDLKAQTELAERIERVVRESDAPALKDVFDNLAFADRALKSLSAPESFRKRFKDNADEFGTQIFAELMKKAAAPGGSMKLLRVRVVDGEPRALFRLILEDGLNYVDFVLTAPAKDKPVRVVDVYVALSGELLSQSVAPFIAKGLDVLKQPDGDGAAVRAAVEKFEAVGRFMSLVRSGKPKDALAAYEKLPAEHKKEKVVMLAHVMTTGSLLEEDPGAYERSMDAFIKKFPTDPAVDLVAIDGYLMKKKYPEFHKTIDRLDKSLGGDPYLHVVRGNGFKLEGKLKEAKAAIGRAIAADPDMRAAYLALGEIALSEKDFKELARLLTVLEARCDVDFSNLATADAFAEFRKSPEYKIWWDARKKK